MPGAAFTRVVRPLLFRLPPDRGHALAHLALRRGQPWRMAGSLARLVPSDPCLRTTFAGVNLPGPVGLAAGFDKDGDLLAAVSSLGFGFVTIGTIMPEARRGNPRPRLVRYPESESLADAMGLPSRGLEHAVARLKRRGRSAIPVFANVGGFSPEAIARGVRAVAPHVDGVEVSLLCPNLTSAEDFDELRLLRDVLSMIEGTRKPVIVRVPNITMSAEDRLAELVDRCADAAVAGLKVAGGRPVLDPRLATGRGTLHGRATFETALENVGRTARLARGRLDIKGNGGIAGAADVLAMRRAGATCVDLYSALVFRGWTIAHRIHRDLVTRGERPSGPTASRCAAARRRAPRARRASAGPRDPSRRD